MRDAVELYLRDLRAIRSTDAATKETSYYQPLATLLNRVDPDQCEAEVGASSLHSTTFRKSISQTLDKLTHWL